MLGSSLWYTESKVPGSDVVTKMGLFYVKLIGTILRHIYGITLAIDIGTELGSVDWSFDGTNDGKLDVLLLGESLGYTDGKVLGNILGNSDIITLGIDVETELVCLDGSFGNIHWILWWPKPHWLHLIFVSDPYIIFVGDPCSNIGNFALFSKESCSDVILPSFSCSFFLQSPDSLRYSTCF